MILKDRVRRYMNKYGLNQKQFAERVGVSRTTFNLWMKYAKKFSKESAQKIEEYLSKEGF